MNFTCNGNVTTTEQFATADQVPTVFICSSSQDETRVTVDLNNFGFFANATLDVNLLSLRLPEDGVNYSKYPVSSVCFCESCFNLCAVVTVLATNAVFSRQNYVLLNSYC